MKVKEDYLFVTHLDHGKSAECYICGICSFDHKHKKGTLPKDFERVEDECQHKKALENSGITPPEGYICRACHPSNQEQGWEEEFDEKFAELKIYKGQTYIGTVQEAGELKSFIKSLLEKQKEEKVGATRRIWYSKGKDEYKKELREKVIELDLHTHSDGHIYGAEMMKKLVLLLFNTEGE